MTNKYIKLHRSLNNWEWKDNPNMMALFMHLALLAYEENNFQIKRTLKDISINSGISIQTVRTCLNRLMESNLLFIEVTSKYSVITLDYQRCFGIGLEFLKTTNNRLTTK